MRITRIVERIWRPAVVDLRAGRRVAGDRVRHRDVADEPLGLVGADAGRDGDGDEPE